MRYIDDIIPVGQSNPAKQRRKRLPGQSWANLIQTDPRYAAHATANAGLSAADASKRQASVRAALIQLGAVPDLQNRLAGLNPAYTEWLNQDVNANVLKQAGDNQYSFMNQANKAHTGNLLNSKDTLAAQGILESGQTGYEIGQENYRHSGAINEGIQGLLQMLSGEYGGFASAEAGRTSDLGEYGDTVKGFLLDEGANPAGSPGEALWDEEQGGYVFNGKLYNEQGQEIPRPYDQTPAGVPPSGVPPPYTQPQDYSRALRSIRRRQRRRRY